MSRWEPTKASLEHLAGVTWDVCSEFLKPDSCILATRVLLDVLQRFGERDVFGWSVQAIAFKESAWQHAKEHGCDEAPWQCDVLGYSEVPSVAILGGNPSDVQQRNGHEYWQGHLAAVVRRRWVVDLTAHQASHPEYDLPIEGVLVFPATEDMLRAKVRVVLGLESGVTVTYGAAPGSDDSWKTSPDWTSEGELRHSLAQATVARLAGRPYEHPASLRATMALLGGRI